MPLKKAWQVQCLTREVHRLLTKHAGALLSVRLLLCPVVKHRCVHDFSSDCRTEKKGIISNLRLIGAVQMLDMFLALDL